jgi:hypothetical protein
MGFRTTRDRLEAIVATLSMPNNTVQHVSDGAAPPVIETPSGTYTFLIDLPSGTLTAEPTPRQQTDRQQWELRCVAPEIDPVPSTIKQVERVMADIGDELIDLFSNPKRLALNGDEIDGIKSVQLRNYRYTVGAYPRTSQSQRYQFILTLDIEYMRG